MVKICRKCMRPKSNPSERKIPWRRDSNPFQYSCLENSMDRGAWQATVHGVTDIDTTEQLTHTHTHTRFGTSPRTSMYLPVSMAERGGCKVSRNIALASLIAQLVKNPFAMPQTPVQFLGQEHPLEKGKAIHSSILAWRILWTVQSMGLQRVGLD